MCFSGFSVIRPGALQSHKIRNFQEMWKFNDYCAIRNGRVVTLQFYEVACTVVKKYVAFLCTRKLFKHFTEL